MNKQQIEDYINQQKKITDPDWILIPAIIGLCVSIFNIYYSYYNTTVIVLSLLINSITFITYFLLKKIIKKKTHLISLFSGLFILILGIDLFISLFCSLDWGDNYKILIIISLLFTAGVCAGLEILFIRSHIKKRKYLFKQQKWGIYMNVIPAVVVGMWMLVQYWLKTNNHTGALSVLYSIIFFCSIIACIYLGTFFLIHAYCIKKIEH
jgi:drug/metabolite transporter (DMT)-like permease